MADTVIPFSLKDAPALIERLLPVQKLSAEAYKEQMAGSGKTLTVLGSYWKGRKPLVLNKACILGSLIPATDDAKQDLAVFELLMAMDDESFHSRLKRRLKPKDVLRNLRLSNPATYFEVASESESFDIAPRLVDPDPAKSVVNWRSDVSEEERKSLEVEAIARLPYRVRVDEAYRAEEVQETAYRHIWQRVNRHLGTTAGSISELVEQLGIMRFGHRPRFGDSFCGSGQIPFEAARLGCDVYASDLNPIACALTWGAFNVVGASPTRRQSLELDRETLIQRVQADFDQLNVEADGFGWRAKVFLYCIEVECPQTGWMVPLLPSRVISRPRTGPKRYVVAQLRPIPDQKRYDILIVDAKADELEQAELGTVRTDGRGQDPYLVHTVNGVEYRTKLSAIRGDVRARDGRQANRLRTWGIGDIVPKPGDVLQERLYCIQWVRTDKGVTSNEYEFRQVNAEDIARERRVEKYVAAHLDQWQKDGLVPDMRIEVGEETERLSRERGWTYWHHLFTPRQLLFAAIVRKHVDALSAFGLLQLVNWNSRLCRWNVASGGGGSVQDTFYNQALNTLFTYASRGSIICQDLLRQKGVGYPLGEDIRKCIQNVSAVSHDEPVDFFVTDPPYGDAVKYEEILEFFIAWLRKNPPAEFADWVWDSRRALAIKGEDEDFRRGMVAAYKRMTECMPDNGIQVIMFTHQSGKIWADMANIVWASGLHVTAAWYVVTETDSALREGSYVKGTVLLVLRKRQGLLKATRDDLAWEIQEEVEAQVASLTGLNQQAKGLYRDENVFEDADIQMAGYAAALRVLTKYATIDGRDMTVEAIRPRVKGEKTFVDGLIEFAVDTANQCLVPQGIAKEHWDKLSGAERFYLKMVDLEARGAKTLDNYQNFAKAFKVRDFKPLMARHKANDARLKSAVEFGRSEMGEGSELYQSVLRATLYALMELEQGKESDEVLAHLALNVANYYGDMTQRGRVVELADYLAQRLSGVRAEEASAARVLREAVRNQRLG